MEKVGQDKVCEMPLLSEQEYYHKLDNILLSSLQFIRQVVFENRWKSETGYDWIDDEGQLTKCMTEARELANKKPQSFQKSALEKKCAVEWDEMSLLSMVIQGFGCPQTYKKENAALRQLIDIRNILALSGMMKKVSQEEYVKNVEVFIASAQALGMEDKKISTIIEKAGITSSLKALEYMNTLHGIAKQLIKDDEIEKALTCFTESINVPSILPINLGTAYEKRAECFLLQVKDPLLDQDKCSAALLDAAKAIELNEFSSVAHFLTAQCYRFQNELPKALSHYKKALAISSAQEEVKAQYDTCKLLVGEGDRGDHMNLVFVPMTLEEFMADLEIKSGIKRSKDDVIRLQLQKEKAIKGQDDVFRGFQYMRGWEVPQNFLEAVQYFFKAAKLKNAEGMYYLAVCYQHGCGVDQNLKVALEMYRKVAEMDKSTPGDMTVLMCNKGVASAQHSLGLLYQEGVGVEQNYTLAAQWYKRAMENGVGDAANNLGVLYSNGLGVPQDEKMAEFCWKQTAKLLSTAAPASRMHYYMQQMEPDKAVDMLRIGREMGNKTLMKMQDSEFNRHVAQIKSQRIKLEPEVIEFEKANKLSSKGLTFKERVTRRTGFLQPFKVKVQKILDKVLAKCTGEEASWCRQGRTLTKETMSTLFLNTKMTSATLSNVIRTLFLYDDILVNLSGYTEGNVCLADDILELLYNSVLLEFHLISFDEVVFEKLRSIVEKLFEKNGKLKGEKDMQSRLCYAVINLAGATKSVENMDAVELLKEGIRRYPDNVKYYQYLSDILGNKGIFTEGRYYAEEGLKLFPDNVELLYSLASHLQNLYRSNSASTTSVSECIAVLNKFLNLAPKNHRKFPDAYYQISLVLMEEYCRKRKPGSIPSGMLDQIKANFYRGQEAEKNQLACYLPYGEGTGKCMVEFFLLGVQQKDGMSSLPKTVPNSEAVKEKEILLKKPYLLSPARKRIILAHREHIKEMDTGAGPSRPNESAMEPKLRQTMAKRMSQVKPIILQKMDPTKDQIYWNKSLDLTVMDELILNHTSLNKSINMICEDENGDMIRLYIYNVGENKEEFAKFQPGCKIAIINPFMSTGPVDNTNRIRNDESKCLMFLEKVENMCRFCGEEDAKYKCAKCKRPYCTRECQVLDWKELNHKLICSLKQQNYDGE